jgi:hypothetical protein
VMYGGVCQGVRGGTPRVAEIRMKEHPQCHAL